MTRRTTSTESGLLTTTIFNEKGIAISENSTLQQKTNIFEKSDVVKLPPRSRHIHLAYSGKTLSSDTIPKGFRIEERELNGKPYAKWVQKGAWLTPPGSNPGFASPEYSPTMYALAVNQMLKNLSGQKLELGTMLAEMHKSARMATTLMDRLLDAVRFAMQRRWSRAAKALGVRPPRRWRSVGSDFSNRWLELQYGWLPLLSDIHSLQEALRQGLVKPATFLVRGNVTKRYNYTAERTNASGQTVKVRAKSGNYGVRCSAIYAMRMPSIQSLKTLGAENPVSVLWNISPWSFLIDWVVSLGDFFNGLTADAGTKFLTGSWTWWYKVRTETIFTEAYKSGGDVGWRTTRVGRWRSTGERFFMSRVPFAESPSASVVFQNNIVNTTRLANAAALLRQLIPQKLRR